MVTSEAPRILFIDAYDSFSHSIVGLVHNTLHADVHVIRIDDVKTSGELAELVRHFDAVVVGPGPGNPCNPQDVGAAQFLWTLSDAELLPVLGICLGFQSMGLAFGAQIARLKQARHGHVCKVTHTDTDVFQGVGELRATQYHSLQVLLESEGENQVSSIQPLAHTLDDSNGNILMAMKIRSKPFWGLQFHPESVCTSTNAKRIISNWWDLSQSWLRKNRRFKPKLSLARISTKSAERLPMLRMHSLLMQVRGVVPELFPVNQPSMHWKVIPLVGGTAADIFERLNLEAGEAFLLDSQGHASGKYSILGISEAGRKIEFTFHAELGMLTLISGTSITEIQVDSQQEFWEVIQEIITANEIPPGDGPNGLPFWGGFIGYISYEAGLDTLDVSSNIDGKLKGSAIPDISFTWISRSVVIDHSTDQVYVQQMVSNSDSWVVSTARSIQDQNGTSPSRSVRGNTFSQYLQHAIIEKPGQQQYCNNVELCKEFLAAGESYELCLTDQTRIYLPISPEDEADYDWALYKQLRTTNPAPFGAFLRTSHVTVVGSSPERFLSWSRSGKCQFRPIKGTVKKRPEIDYEAASAILNSPKERAENLMIVDLIRHDLSGIVGSANCSVPKLMQVEEYATVYQLVSVIEGQLDKSQSSGNPSGINVLAASLPPGSMTGAPKKRSCELLAQMEEARRGIYSGVLGYIDVGGGGDFSVVIRTAVKQRNEVAYKVPRLSNSGDLVPHHVWRVGAGGAVTIQSTSEGEFDEMETKLDSVLPAFQVG